jgi:membrane-bound serine protease (ClpP class)
MLVLLLFIVAVIFVYIELFLHPEMAFWIVAGELVAATVLILIGIKTFPRSHAGRLLILRRSLDKKFGYSGTEPLDEYVGKEGESLTHLRPAGIAKIGARRLDVVSEGTFIDKGKRLKVVAVEGNRVVVRETETTT